MKLLPGCLDFLKKFGSKHEIPDTSLWNMQFAGFQAVYDSSIVQTLVNIDPRFSQHENALMQMITESGTILNGHFCHEDETHSLFFVRIANFVRFMKNLKMISEWLSQQVKENEIVCDAIVTPESAGSMLAGMLSYSLKSRSTVHQQASTDSQPLPTVFARTDDWGNPSSFINPDESKNNLQVLLVDGIMLNTDHLQQLGILAKKQGYHVVGSVVFGKQYPLDHFPKELGSYILWMADLSKIEVYAPRDCPQCKPLPARLIR